MRNRILPIIPMLGLALAGCQTPAATPTTTVTTTVASPATTAPSTPSTPATTSKAPTSAPATTSAPTTPAPGGVAAECNIDKLTVTMADDPDGTGAGHIGRKITVVNTGDTCQLPAGTGLLFLKGPELTGTLGATTKFDAPSPVIPAGKAVVTQVQQVQPGNIPDCQPAPAYYLGVSIPGQKSWARVHREGMTACANPEVKNVSAVKPWVLA